MYELREWCKIIGVNLFTYRLLCLERGLHCGERKQRLVLHILRNYRSKPSQESKQQIRKIYVSSDLQLPNMAEFDLVSRPEDEKIHLSPRSHRCTAVSLFWQRTPEKAQCGVWSNDKEDELDLALKRLLSFWWSRSELIPLCSYLLQEAWITGMER